VLSTMLPEDYTRGASPSAIISNRFRIASADDEIVALVDAYAFIHQSVLVSYQAPVVNIQVPLPPPGTRAARPSHSIPASHIPRSYAIRLAHIGFTAAGALQIL
jgi:hypothetical protein